MNARALTLIGSLAWLAPLMAAGGCGPGLEPPAPASARASTPPAAGSSGAKTPALPDAGAAGPTAAPGQAAAAGSSGQNEAAADAKDADAGVEAADAATP